MIPENSTYKNDSIKILGIDAAAFPEIKVSAFANRSCAMIGNLKKEHFKVIEDSNDTTINDFYFTGKAPAQNLDLAIVFDDTGSMKPEIEAMKSKVKDLTDKIKASELDANYALVSFKDTVSIKTSWTNNPDILKKNIEALHADAGGDEPEDSLDAIEAVLSIGFRPNAQKVILVITDADAHYKNDGSKFSNFTKEQVENDLKENGIIFIPVSPPNLGVRYIDLKNIAKDIHGFWLNMGTADFSNLLEKFKMIITGTYVIDYVSPNQSPFGNRYVTLIVDAPGCLVGRDSSSYMEPNSAEFWYSQGHSLDLEDKYHEALLSYEKAIELDPLYAEAWSGKGHELIGLGRYDEAIQAFNKAIEIKPDFSDAWAYKGLALNKQNKHDQSIQALDKAIELEPLYAEAWNLKGIDLFDLGKYDEALQALDKATQINPDFATAWAIRGTALKALGRLEEADAALSKAKELGYKE